MASDLKTAADYAPEAVKWLWLRHLPEGFVCIVGGPPGGGKSLFCSYLTADFTRRDMNVMYSSTENPKKQMTIPRLMAAGARLPRVDLRRWVLPQDLKRLEQSIMADNVKLVILDPIADHLTVSRHSDAIRSVSYPLVEMAERCRCVIVLTEHILRDVSPKMHPLRAITGSGSGLPAVAQMVYLVGRDPEDSDRTMLAPAKANLVEGDLLSVAFMFDEADVEVLNDKDQKEDTTVGLLRLAGETKFSARKLLSASDPDNDSVPPTKMAAAREWLTNYLKVAPDYRARAKDIREDAIQNGHARKTLDRAVEDMGVVKQPPGGGKYTTWELPQELIDILPGDDG